MIYRYELEDDSIMRLEITQNFMYERRVTMRPRSGDCGDKELAKEIRLQFNAGEYPNRTGTILCMGKEPETGEEWTVIYVEKEDLEIMYNNRFWTWS